jgi:hypothetical protein
MREIIESIAKLLSISTVIAICCYYLGYKFIPCFVLATVLQFISWSFYQYWIDSRTQIQLEELVNERVKEFRYQSLDCTCPDENCNFVASVPIMLNGPNTYECPKCKKEVKVYIGNKTFLTTTPIDPDPFKEFNFVENKDYDN